MAASPESPLRPWRDLLPELLGDVIARLPFPADRVRLRAVCRGWRSAARRHTRQLPWLVMPDGSFCTVGNAGALYFPLGTIPGDATCVGSTDGWLALDRTDDAYRRTDELMHSAAYKGYPRRDVNHRHSYLLHNPFSGATVPLPELDAVIGHVSEMFEIRKVLMRSSAPDDVIAIMTNSINCNVIMCHPGKGTFIVTYSCICDIAFIGEWLYGITPREDLFAFHPGEDDDGKPTIVDCRRVIKHQFTDGEEDPWIWMDDNDDGNSNDDNDNGGDGDGGGYNDDRPPNQEEEDGFHGDGLVPDGIEIGPYTEGAHKGHAITTRRLVKSHGVKLLMVRRLVQQPPFTSSYIREVEVFKADMDAGKWIPVPHNGLAQDEAIFLSPAFCKSSPVCGDMKAGFIYGDDTNEMFETRSWASSPFRIPGQTKYFWRMWTTWIFPPELVV